MNYGIKPDIERINKIDPTDTLKKALNALWEGPAIEAPKLLRQLANEMEVLHIINDGQQYGPDITLSIEESEPYLWLVENTTKED